MGLINSAKEVAILSLFCLCTQFNYAQTNTCNISSPNQPDRIFAGRHAMVTTQSISPIGIASWENLDKTRVSDDEHLSVVIEAYQRSHKVHFTNFNFNVPEHATIDGLRIKIEGKSEGEGNLNEIQLQFQTAQGIIGEDAAGQPPLFGIPWNKDSISIDKEWMFGYQTALWGKSWSAEEINHPDFGFSLQLENTKGDSISAMIDQVEIVVYYTPIFDICQEVNYIFHTEPIPGVEQFNWQYPSNFQIIASPVNQHILNLEMVDNTMGSYEVCVTPEGGSQCCWDFMMGDCSAKAELGDRVWEDRNDNGIQDPDEIGLANIKVDLYGENGKFLAYTFTDQNGFYLFDDLERGSYQIRTQPPSSLYKISESPEDSEEGSDSDYNLAFGVAHSNFIHLEPGDSNLDLDFGWSFIGGDIRGMAWRDRNGNGMIENDPAIIALNVYLLDCNGQILANTLTNSLGYYEFVNFPIGDYIVATDMQTSFAPVNGGDSYLIMDSASNFLRTECVVLSAGETKVLNIGLNPKGDIGNYIFRDTNANGIQDDSDIGIENATISLFDKTGVLIGSTVSNIHGNYFFDMIPSGEYYINVETGDPTLTATITNIGEDHLDSDGTEVSLTQVSTEIFAIYDGSSMQNYDFGFISRMGTIDGYFVLDGNGDGSSNNDPGIASTNITLHYCDGTQHSSIITDGNGYFSFLALTGFDYYLSFPTSDTYELSDLANSDIDNSIQVGGTSCFRLEANQSNQILAAAIPYSTIGDRVWLDQNENGIQDDGESGIEGALIILHDISGGMISSSVTNADGHYSFSKILPGSYFITVESSEHLSTVSNQGTNIDIDSNGIEMNGSITSENFTVDSGIERFDIDFGLKSIGGAITIQIWRDSNGDKIFENEIRLEGITCYLKDCSGTLVDSSISNSDGFVDFNSVPEGDYYILTEVSESFVSVIGGDSQITSNLELNATDCFFIANQTSNSQTIGLNPLGSIGDYVWDDKNKNGLQDIDESGIESIQISLFNQDNEIIASSSTDSNGNYGFTKIPSGKYQIHVTVPEGNFILTEGSAGNGDNDSEGMNIGSIIESSQINLFDGINQLGHDFGFYEVSGLIQGTVWRDSDGDKNFINEQGQDGIQISLFNCDSSFVANTTSSNNGNFQFDNLVNGSYFIQMVTGDEYVYITGGDSQITDLVAQGATDCFEFENPNIENIILGIQPLSKIGDFVWKDENKNGTQDIGEVGFEGINIALFNSNDILIELSTTNALGHYSFDNLTPGAYYLEVNKPEGLFQLTESNVGDTALDSEGIDSNDQIRSDDILLQDGIDDLNRDFGFIEYIPQGKISGTYSNDRDGDGILSLEPGYSGETIILSNCDGGEIATLVTDENGYFEFINIESGEYYIQFPPKENSVFQTDGESQINNLIAEGSSDCFTHLSDQDIVINGGSIPLSKVGDYIWIDENKDGIQDSDEAGKSEIEVNLHKFSDGTILSSALSDEAGEYFFDKILPGKYFVSIAPQNFDYSPSNIGNDPNLNSDGNLMVSGLLASQEIILFDGNEDFSVDFGLIEPEISNENEIEGIVFEDNNGNGILDIGESLTDNISVQLIDLNGNIMDSSITGEDGVLGGYYFFGFPDGQYRVQFELSSNVRPTQFGIGEDSLLDSELLLSDGVYQTSVLDFNVSNEMTGINAGYFYLGSIGDYIWYDFDGDGIQDNEELGANEIQVTLYNSEGTQVKQTSSGINPLTGEFGYYLFNDLFPGEYYIQLSLSFGNSFTESYQGETSLDSDIDGANGLGSSSIIKLESGQQNSTIDVGIISSPGSIGNFVWNDENGNGTQETSEVGLNGITVSLYDKDSNLIESTITKEEAGNSGYYIFENIVEGQYYVVFDLQNMYSATIAFKGGNTSLDSDVTNELEPGATNIFEVGNGISIIDIDCGLFIPSSIGDYVWMDNDKDGRQEFGEWGLSDVDISLYRIDEGMVDQVLSDGNGRYKFENVRPGEYYISVEQLEDYQFTDQFAGGEEEMDNNINLTGLSEEFTVEEGVTLMHYDIGFIPSKSRIGGRTWLDDQNGLQDSDEDNLVDVTVHLLNADKDIIQSTSTNAMGRYVFSNFDPGNYYIEFEAPFGLKFTEKDISFNDFEDSDPNQFGRTDLIMIGANESLLNVDAGFVIDELWNPDQEKLNLVGKRENGNRNFIWQDQNINTGTHYTILRSSDGKNFISIGSLHNKIDEVNTFIQSSYQNLPYAEYFKIEKYKHQQLIASSNIWKDKGLEHNEMMVYPIPASETFFVDFDLEQISEATYKIFDVDGLLVKEASFSNLSIGNNTIEVSMSGYKSGFYILQLNLGNTILTKRINILK